MLVFLLSRFNLGIIPNVIAPIPPKKLQLILSTTTSTAHRTLSTTPMASKRAAMRATSLRLASQSSPRTSLPYLRTTPPSLPPRRHISAYGYEQAKALTFSKYGEPADVLSLHTHSISPAHSNNLTIRFLAAPINPADINQIQGVYPSKPSFTTSLGTASPLAVGGNEGVAEVLSVGSAVKGLCKGDWVVMKAPGFGTWRTHAQTTADRLLRIDDRAGLSALTAATVSINPCTAYRLLRDFGALRPGDWVVQNGANSGVGRAAVQLARLWGFRSLNVVRDRDADGLDALKRELRGLGADVVVSDSELQAPEFRDRLMAWTDGGRQRVGLALNCVGGKPATALAKTLAPGGCMVTYGAMSKQPLVLPASLLIFKDVRFCGFWVSKWSEREPEEKKRTVEHVLELVRKGEFKDMPVDEIPWEWETKEEELVGAVKGTLEGFRKGKGVFVFGQT